MEGSQASEPTTTWQPNEELLEMLIGMGISKIAAEHALYYTGNQSAEAAASYVFDNPDIDVMPPLIRSKRSKRRARQDRKSEDEEPEEGDDEAGGYKMVFVVNSALNMGVGKVASQCAHACLGIYKLMSEFQYMTEVIEEWEDDGEKKIVLKGENHIHLKTLEDKAKKFNLFSYLIHDAGRTQVPPNSVTVLALFGDEMKIDQVTGELSLL